MKKTRMLQGKQSQNYRLVGTPRISPLSIPTLLVLDTTNVPHRSWWANFATLWGATSYHIVATPHAMESRHTRYSMYPYFPLLHGDTGPL